MPAVLRPVADGVLVHESEFCQSNAVLVCGRDGVLLVDAGVVEAELVGLANDPAAAGQTVVAGFSTHPHWDHLLWHPLLGDAPRYGSAACAATIRERRAAPGWSQRVTAMMPPEVVGRVPLALLGEIDGLSVGTTHVPWDGPRVSVIEHQAHASGHVALLVDEVGVLIAGDMLSDVLVPMLDLNAADPTGDYGNALESFAGIAGEVEVVVPGHGSVGRAGQVVERIEQDRAYVDALRTEEDVSDPRLGPGATFDWVLGVHEWQRQRLADQ